MNTLSIRPNTTKFGGLGWVPPLPRLGLPYYQPPQITLPASVNLQSNCPAIYDQGQLGSCTANAVSGLAEFLMIKEGHWAFVPSRLAIYYWERVIEGTTDQDSGASIADSIHVVSNTGCPPESDWWYNINKFTIQPNETIVKDANKHKVSNYANIVPNLYNLQACLASGYMFIFGFTVYQSFESNAVAMTGIVPMPQPGEQILGGHAVGAVGYDNSTQMFLVRNSWGTGWGLNGYCWMPYEYLTDSDLASDMWTAKTIA